MGAVKNVGEAAVQEIKREREEGEESRSKVHKMEGESRGEIVKDVDGVSTFRNLKGKMVDSIDEEEWEKELEDIAGSKRPMIRIHGGGIVEEQSWRSNRGGGIGGGTWRRNQRGGIMEAESWKRNHGGGIRGGSLDEDD